MTNSLIDPSRASTDAPTRQERSFVRRARAGVAAAGRSKRRGGAALGAAVVVAATAAALRAAGDQGGAAQVAVAAAGGTVTFALVLARGRLARRWQAVTLVAAAGGTAVLYAASADGWPGRTPTVLVTFGVVAVAGAGAVTATWSASRGFWRLVGLVVAAGLATVPDQAGLHRLGVIGLAAGLLVTVARGFSKVVLRAATTVLLLAALVALVWIGDRAVAADAAAPGSAAGGTGPVAGPALFDDIATEAASLRDELPCGRRTERVPDERLCEALATLTSRAERAADAVDTDAGGAAGAAGATARTLDTTLADLREQVAVRLLRSGDEAPARVELAEAQAERTRQAAADAADADQPDIRTLAARGMDTVVADALDPFVADPAAARLGGYGWAAMALLLILGYRQLEVVNNRRYGAPVTVGPFATGPGDEGAALDLEATLRNRVAEIVLREPPPVPGAESTAKPTPPAVAALDARAVPPAGSVRTLLARIRGLVAPVPGITVEPTYTRLDGPEHGDAGPTAGSARVAGDPDAAGDGRGMEPLGAADVVPSAGPAPSGPFAPSGALAERAGAAAGRVPDDAGHVVTVRLVTTQGRRTLRARSFARPTARAAAEAAADFAVCDALAHGRLTPSWARWRSDDGAALAPYHTVLADTGRTGPRLPLAEQIELLETARAASPGTGLVLVELGHRYDLDERPLDALRAHLTAKALHPRFAQPRYRLSVSLEMLASPVRFAEHWLAPGRDEQRRQVAELLVETGLVARARRTRWWRMADPRCPVDPDEAADWLAQPDPTPGTQRDILKVFLVVARTELRALERRLGYAGLLAGATRQAERHVWWGLLCDPERRRVTRHRYRSARWIAELRLALLPTQPGTRKARELRRRVDAMARRTDVGSTALYNAACFTSVLVDRAPRKGRERAELEEQAVHHLRRVARGGAGPVPSSGWLTTDPDLIALQAVPAFNDLVRRLAHDEDRRAAAGHG